MIASSIMPEVGTFREERRKKMNLTAQNLCEDLQSVRTRAPLIHSITNFVVMNNTANALLAIGASPVMAHAIEEVEEMASLASALVVNIGTLDRQWVESMKAAMRTAQGRGIPIVLDPVGAGATAFRTQTCLQLIEQVPPTVIRGNASEIMALAGQSIKTKGVDSLATEKEAQSAAFALAEKYSCVVCVSGAIDLITDGVTKTLVRRGHAMMPRVTGLGCTATALIAAFCAVNKAPLAAAVHGMTVMGICGEIAAEKANGPGSLQVYFIDALYSLDSAGVKDRFDLI